MLTLPPSKRSIWWRFHSFLLASPLLPILLPRLIGDLNFPSFRISFFFPFFNDFPLRLCPFPWFPHPLNPVQLGPLSSSSIALEGVYSPHEPRFLFLQGDPLFSFRLCSLSLLKLPYLDPFGLFSLSNVRMGFGEAPSPPFIWSRPSVTHYLLTFPTVESYKSIVPSFTLRYTVISSMGLPF